MILERSRIWYEVGSEAHALKLDHALHLDHLGFFLLLGYLRFRLLQTKPGYEYATKRA